jgi:N-acetylmuramoyl-L-alanine amidase
VKKTFFIPVLLSVFLLTTGSVPNIKPSSLKVRTVVIDAGHGGKDPGCHGALYKEKDIALAVALKLGKFIEDNFKDVKVIFTRKTDVFVELNERAAIANRNNADLFICVHCNSACVYDKKTHKDICNEDAHGSETYVMGVNKDVGNLAVAKRENQSILLEDDYKKKYEGFDPNSDEANIIFAFYQSVFHNQSLSLASKIQECYKQKAGRNDKGVQQAGFLVLWKTAMPSLLTEIGFLTNHKEEKFLGSDNGQTYMASSIFRAFRMYKNEVEGLSQKYNDDFEKTEPYNSDKDTTAGIKPEKKPEVPVKTSSSDHKKEEAKPIPEVVSPAKSQGGTKINGPLNSPTQTRKDSTPDDKYDSHAYPKKDLKTERKGVDSVLVYKVLFYTSEKKLDTGDKKFEGVDTVELFEEGGRFKYTAGKFSHMNDAAHLQSLLRKKGFKDAFVTGFQNGKRVK